MHRLRSFSASNHGLIGFKLTDLRDKMTMNEKNIKY